MSTCCECGAGFNPICRQGALMLICHDEFKTGKAILVHVSVAEIRWVGP